MRSALPAASGGPGGPIVTGAMEVRRILVGARGVLGRDLVRRYRERGIESVAAFAEADAETPYVDEADYPGFLGPGPADRAWSAPTRLVELAMDAGCDAIHPGRGPASGALELYAAAAAANVLVIGLDPRRAAEALDVVRMMSRVRAAGLQVPPAEAVDPAADGIEAAARIGVPLWVLPAHGGRGARVTSFDGLAAELAEVRGPAGAVLVHEVLGDGAVDVVLVGDRDGVVPLGAVSTSGSVATYPSDDPHQLVDAALRIGREIGLVGVATVRFRIAADGSPWWWAIRPHQPAAAALVEAIQGIDLVQAELAAASGQRLGWSGRDAAGAAGHGVVAFVSRTGPGRVDGIRLPEGEGIRTRAAVEVGSTLKEDAEPVLLEVVSVAAEAEVARDQLLAALAATRIDGLSTDLAEVAAAIR
jgi:biotin carboxylase